jgi:hypothetical protein
MNSVFLNGSGHVYQVLVDHRDERGMVLGRKIAEHLVKCADVILPVVRRQGDPGKQHLDVGIVQRSQNRIKILARLLQGKATQPVVAAKFNDHNRRMGLDHRPDVDDCVLRRRSAGAHIRNFVGISPLVKVPLQCLGKGLAGVQTMARSDAIAVANEHGPVGGDERRSADQQAKRNENPAPNVHMYSVMSQKGNGRWPATVYTWEDIPGD